MPTKYDRVIECKPHQKIPFSTAFGHIQLICCGCGLTHEIEITPRGMYGFNLEITRNEEATGQRRRALDKVRREK